MNLSDYIVTCPSSGFIKLLGTEDFTVALVVIDSDNLEHICDFKCQLHLAHKTDPENHFLVHKSPS